MEDYVVVDVHRRQNRIRPTTVGARRKPRGRLGVGRSQILRPATIQLFRLRWHDKRPFSGGVVPAAESAHYRISAIDSVRLLQY